ncbi:myosin phosphatase Rho-interacting protein-like isoform 2-T2 [Odontesthes bonariensis]|uniref:myosin phosphatase Rho-interacting protein-like isoform X2 n=1 Tax=Odontesthes bonariensis TaxID=219752 RepID=UPI003F582F8F
MLQRKLQALCKEQDVKLMAEQEALNHEIYQLQEDNSVLKEELEQAGQKILSVETGNQKLLEDIQKIEDFHNERMQKLEANFQEKIKELQHIHEEEMKHLHGSYTKSCASREKNTKPDMEAPHFTEGSNGSPLSDQAVTERTTKDLDIQMVEADAGAIREAYLKDLEKLQASCDQGFTAMEEMHKKLIRDLQQQHQKQVAELLKEKDQLLQEETAATMAAIVAMRRAHKQELERSKQFQHIRESTDITELHLEYEKEIQLLHKELEVLSGQHTEKCLENSQLSQELQDERKSMMQFQKENQDLRKKQREVDETSKLHEDQSHVVPQMILRSKETEMQFLRQEARSLREELEIARMDKVYMEMQLKAVSLNNRNEADQRVNKDSKFATWSPSRDTSRHSLDDSVAAKNNPAFLKKTEKSSIMRQLRGIRSKSIKDGLSLQERLKLFESF